MLTTGQVQTEDLCKGYLTEQKEPRLQEEIYFALDFRFYCVICLLHLKKTY